MALQVWLPLNGTTKNKGILNDVSFSNGTFTDSGKIGKALSTGYATMSAAQTSKVLNNKQFSLCFWIYVNTNDTSLYQDSMIFGNESMSANNNRKYSIFQYPTANDIHWSWQNDAASTTYAGGVLTGVLPSYKWTHVCVTYNNPNGKWYINGNLYSTFSGISNSSTFAYDTYLMRNSNRRFINDYRIYDSELSAAEVKEISKGLVLHYPLNQPNRSRNLITNSKSVKIEATNFTGATLSLTFDSVMNNLKSYAGQKLWISYDYEVRGCVKGSYTYGPRFVPGFSYVNSSGTSAWDCEFSFNPGENSKGHYSAYRIIPSNMSSYNLYGFPMQFNADYVKVWNVKYEIGELPTPYTPSDAEENSTVEYDCSGYGNNGTVTSTSAPSISNDAKRYDKSYYFIDNSKYIYSNIFMPGGNQITMSYWFKSNTTGFSSYHIPLCINSSNYEMSINSSGQLRGGLAINGSRVIADNGSGLLNGQWHMCTLTYDGSTIKRYIDGSLVGSTSSSGTLSSGNMELTIGRYGSTNTTYGNKQAYMSDVRVYATTLSPEDVQELYNTSAKIDKNGTLMCYEIKEE